MLAVILIDTQNFSLPEKNKRWIEEDQECFDFLLKLAIDNYNSTTF